MKPVHLTYSERQSEWWPQNRRILFAYRGRVVWAQKKHHMPTNTIDQLPFNVDASPITATRFGQHYLGGIAVLSATKSEMNHRWFVTLRNRG